MFLIKEKFIKLPLMVLLTNIMIMPAFAGNHFVSTDQEATGSRVNISVAVRSSPCNIDSDEAENGVDVDFQTVMDTDLYSAKAVEKPFSIKLKDCNTTDFNTLKVAFTGTEDTALPGLLALTGASSTDTPGFAVGFRTSDGKDVKVNAESASFDIKSGDMSLDFIAYLKGEADAITNKTISTGDFTAQATLAFSYE